MPTPTLDQLQRTFNRAIVESAPDWQSLDLPIVSDADLPAEVRMDVYRHAFLVRMATTLRKDFPYVAAWLGDEFKERVREYLQMFPSPYHSMLEIGRSLGLYFRKAPRPTDPAFLPALADYEWAQCFAAMADRRARPPVLAAAELAQADFMKLRPVVNPSLILHTTDWNVDRLHRPTGRAIAQKLRLAIYRGRDRVHGLRLGAREMRLWELLRQSPPMEQVLEWVAAETLPPEKLQAYFAKWTQREMFYGFTLAP